MKWYIFLITILGILSSEMINALDIVNSTNYPLEIIFIREGTSKPTLMKFTATEDKKKKIIISSNSTFRISNKVQPVYVDKGEKQDAEFDKLSIWVQYRGNSYNFNTGLIEKNTSNYLKEGRATLVLKIPSTIEQQKEYYFNKTAPLDQLNARFGFKTK